MKGKDLRPGDIIVGRTSEGVIFETDMIQTIDSGSIRQAYVIRQWPNEPTRLMKNYGTEPLVRYIGSDSFLEVLR